jgi:hypothetical protein
VAAGVRFPRFQSAPAGLASLLPGQAPPRVSVSSAA